MSTTTSDPDNALGAVQFDHHGIRPVPERDRTSSASHQFWIWAGANASPISWIVGTLGPTLGLSLVQCIIVLAIGQAVGAALFAAFCVMGHRTGATQMVLSRMAFGRRGAYPFALVQGLIALAWVGVITYLTLDLAVGILKQLGVPGGHGTTYIVAAVIMVIQVAIGTVGFYAIRTFEKWTVPLLVAIMAIMTVLAVWKGHIVWNHATVSGSGSLTAMSQLLTAVGVGWAYSWIMYAGDYNRFVRPSVTTRRLFWANFTATYIPLLWLGVLGAAMASGSSKDPATLVASLFGVMTVPVLFVLIHGPIANNVLNVYSASLAFLGLDVKLKRWAGSLVAAAVSSVLLVVFLASSSFANTYIGSFVVWIAPWIGVMGVSYFVVHRGKVDVDGLYAWPPQGSRYGDVNWRGITSFVIGFAAAWSVEYGTLGIFQGPISTAAGNLDISWLVGMLVAGGAYYLLERARRSAAASSGSTAPSGESFGPDVTEDAIAAGPMKAPSIEA